MGGKWIYIIIYILTVFDIVFTYSGLQNGFIAEANPLMAFLLTRCQFLTFAGVLASVAIALYFSYRVRARVKWLPGALMLVLATKISVVFLHISWIVKLI